MKREIQKAPQSFSTLFNMLQMIWKANPRASIGYIFLIFFESIIPLAITWYTKLLFDLLAQNLAGNTTIAWTQTMPLLLGLVIFTIGNQLTTPVSTFLNAELTRNLTVKIQSTIYEKLISFVGIAYFESPEFYDKIQLAERGAQRASSNILRATTAFLKSTITLVSFLGVLLVFSPGLVGLIILTSLPYLYAQIKFSQKRFALAHEMSPEERQRFFFSYILSSVHAAKEVRLFNLGEYLLNKTIHLFRKVNRAERSHQLYELRWELPLGFLSSALAGGAFIIVIRWAFMGLLSLGDVTLYTGAIGNVQNALKGIILAFASLNEGLLFFSYYEDLLNLPQPLPLTKTPKSVKKLMSGIELRSVSFRYSQSHPWILRDVNLFIPSGCCLALVGLNGAGKSTIVKLLTRLYDPTGGQILWDGIDIREFNPIHLRLHMGVILQDFMRYDLTVKENIGLGDVENVDKLENVLRAAKKAGIHSRIENLPQAYETKISLMFGGEKPSVNLSGGEWQKVALARMFMRQSELLILDEPTSAFDPQAEYEMNKRFAQLSADQTSILISHRFSTVHIADVIAVLENGKITEYGSHKQLLGSGKTYAKLYKMQTKRCRDNRLF